jgi:hypothetical protein
MGCKREEEQVGGGERLSIASIRRLEVLVYGSNVLETRVYPCLAAMSDQNDLSPAASEVSISAKC